MARRLLGGGALGAVSAVAGLTPWLVTGARLPLQNLWARETLPEDMPLALLPVNQYYVSTIVALLVVAGAAAGLAARRSSRLGLSVPAAAVGLGAVHALAIGQTFVVVHDGLDLGDRPDARATLYFVGMLVGTLLAGVVAQVAFWLTSRRAPVPVAVGLVLSAVPLASWLGAWSSVLAGPGSVLPGTVPLVRWLPAVVVAVALAWLGWTPLRRLVVWAVGAVVLLLVPPVVTAVTSALGTRSLLGDPAETVAVMVAVLRAAAGADVLPTVTALSAAALLVAGRAYTRKRA